MSKLDQIVSQHALVRWLEYRRGYKMIHIRAEMIAAGRPQPISDHDIVEYLGKWHRLDLTKIRREIYSSSVAICISRGAMSIPLTGEHHGFTLCIGKDKREHPVITTVIPSRHGKDAKVLANRARKKRLDKRVANRIDRFVNKSQF